MAQLQNPLQFDCQNPYPLLPEDSYTYGDAKNHSRAVDEWLGLDLDEPQPSGSHLVVEAQTWSHLSTQQFQTPYCEIRNILDHLRLQPKQTLVDLGCGYGRFAYVLNRHYPGVIFKGYEVDSHRVQRAKEKFQFHQLHNAEVCLEDISGPSFIIPKAEYYFIFDFGNTQSILEILEKLKILARNSPITVVGRGRATRHYIQELHPWLSQVNEPQHRSHYSIYKS